MVKIKSFISSKLFISTVLILLSSVGVILQNVLKIKPFCSKCRELDCAFCEMKFNWLIFFTWLIGLILLIVCIKTKGLKKASFFKKVIVILDILLLCFCFIFPCIFLAQMFQPYNSN